MEFLTKCQQLQQLWLPCCWVSSILLVHLYSSNSPLSSPPFFTSLPHYLSFTLFILKLCFAYFLNSSLSSLFHFQTFNARLRWRENNWENEVATDKMYIISLNKLESWPFVHNKQNWFHITQNYVCFVKHIHLFKIRKCFLHFDFSSWILTFLLQNLTFFSEFGFFVRFWQFFSKIWLFCQILTLFLRFWHFFQILTFSQICVICNMEGWFDFILHGFMFVM